MRTFSWILARGAVLTTLAALAAAQAPPRVAELSPRHGAAEVDPRTTTRLTARFDRPMDTRRHAVCGGGPSFPAVTAAQWLDEHTLSLAVDLEPDRVYTMSLACAGSAGFHGKDGGALAETPWHFATAGEPLPDGAAARAAERLFAAIRDHYSYRDHLGIDWRRLERDHAPTLAACTSGAALALATAELLATAQDVHVTVRWRDASLPTWRRQVAANFDLRGLQRRLPKLTRVGRVGLAARTEDDIGYLFVGSFAREQRRDFDQLLQTLRTMLDCRALVLDVRTNGGGDELLARRLAAFFVEGERVYAAHRVRDPRAPDGFGDRQDRRIKGNEPPDAFRGPVAVLMGPQNMSSCEAFLLMMKQAGRAFLVGERSYGSSGNPQPHDLAPGLAVLLPSWQALRPDGSGFEGEGIAPHLHVAASAAELAEGDPVLDEALLRLRRER